MEVILAEVTLLAVALEDYWPHRKVSAAGILSRLIHGVCYKPSMITQSQNHPGKNSVVAALWADC